MRLLSCLLLAACGGTNPYQGFSAERLYDVATAEYEEGEYGNAIEALDRLLITYGDWGRAPEARLLLAHAHFAKGDFLTARSEYLRFVDRYPTLPETPVAALGVCRSLAELSPHPERDQSYTRDAMTVCRNVVVDYAGTEQAQAAADIANQMRVKMAEKEYRGANFYFRRGLFDSAIKYYEFVASLYPETEYAPMALLGIYLANLEIGYEDEAAEARQRLIDRYPDSQAAQQVRTNGQSG